MLTISNFEFESDKILLSLLPSDKNYFLSKAEQLTFKKGKLIFYNGGIPTGAFLIKKGRAKIYKTGVEGKDQIFYIYKKDDLFGYHGLLSNERYEDSCEALEDCTVWFISRADFEHLLIKIPKLKTLLIQNMSHEFGVLVNTITVLAQKSLRERLAIYLLVLNERYDCVNGRTQINLSREDLANIIGTARESLGRLLKEFKDDKLIKINSRSIEIINFDKMLKLAQIKKGTTYTKF